MRSEVAERTDATNERASLTRGRWTGGSWTGVLAPWLVSQLISGAALILSRSWNFDDRFRWSPFTIRWDGGHYLGIAELGYGLVDVRFSKWAFFPGLPAIIRGLGDLGIDERIGIHVVNQLALLLALVGLRWLALRRGSATAASLAVWSMALFPAAFVFSMTYPSALFAAAAVWAFVLVELRQDLAAGVLAAGATLLRPTGLAVALALVVAVRAPRRVVFVLVPSVAAIVAWCVYCYDRTGDALVWLTTKSQWQEITAFDALTGELKLSLVPHVTLAAAGLAVVVVQRRRLPPSWLALTGVLILPGLLTGTVGLARYTVECFVPFVAAGQVLEERSRRVRLLVLAAGAVGLAVFAYVVGRYRLVP